MSTTRSLDGPTPNGGVKSTIYFQNAKGELVDESDATAAEIVEFDANDNQIFRTYMEIAI